MKIRGKTIFTIVNSVVIFVLLIITAMLLFVANSQNKELFGKQIRLVESKGQDGEANGKCLVFVLPQDFNKLSVGDYFLYSAGGVPSIAKAEAIENNTVTYSISEGDMTGQLSLSDTVQSDKYIGKITYKSNFFGEFFFAIASKETISLTFILIFGVFVLSMLSLVISYLIYTKKKYSVAIDEAQAPKQEETEQADPEILPADYEEDKVLAELAEVSKQFTQDFLKIEQTQSELVFDKALAPQKNPTDIEEELANSNRVEEIVSEAARLKQQQSYQKAFEEVIKKPPAAPYYLSDEDVPSIESIMASIDKQFSEDNDDDVKIFIPK